jgi:hypothetical protein
MIIAIRRNGIAPYFFCRYASAKIEERKSPPICAADIFVVNWGPSARTCLSYALFEISIEGESEIVLAAR